MLSSLRGRALEREERAQLALRLAEQILELSLTRTERVDQGRAELLSRLMLDPHGQALTTSLTDCVYRSQEAKRVLSQLAHLVERYGVPAYMTRIERAELACVAALSKLGVAQRFTARAVLGRVREQARGVLLSSDERALRAHLEKRHQEGVRVNVNLLGEALLGEREAEARVARYMELAGRGDVDALSVKVSSIGSQLNLFAFEHTTSVLAERLTRIYRATLDQPESKRAIVMLDMEAYDDVDLTLAVMRRALEGPALDGVRAGVVLQAYLPDSNLAHEELLGWARARRARGAGPLRMRLVKGANLASERVESSKRRMTLPIFASKEEVDANYKRLLERAITKENLDAIELGVASHNVFDLAYALVLQAERGAKAGVGFEMLEGMADPVGRALRELGADVLLYAPLCRDDEMNTGIAYLVRRLDENTSPENFLRSSFGMTAGSESFALERERFLRAVARVDAIDERPRRAFEERHARTSLAHPDEDFRGELDTDLSRAENRALVRAALSRAAASEPAPVRSWIAGTWADGEPRVGVDPSRPGITPYRMALASASDVERALACAANDPSSFSQSSPTERARLLSRVAEALRGARHELIAALVMDGGKRVVEADIEVSEAIDFAEYYRASLLELVREHPVEITPRGTVVVTPPWNFPLAIPAGGVLAALMSGNRVILKPALETAYVADRLVRLLFDAGVPSEALQLVVCEDHIASRLIEDPRVHAVVLTGATDTARLFQRLRPGLHLLAETGGKNAYIVSAMSDRELAIRDVVHSAFAHAGQKCSAASLLLLEAEVYDDPAFLATLKDAVESLHVGSAWDPRTFVTPLIRPPEGPLLRALTTLEPGESWLVKPRIDASNPRLVSPGVKLGVREGSFSHVTELFGPVLSVMRAQNLDRALELANASGYGLTAGLASLDDREKERFVEHIRAGNVYVNRTITGAIVRRQPFGGHGKSGFGPGAKAGGPNYVTQLGRVRVLERARGGAQPVQASALPEGIAGRLEQLRKLLSAAEGHELFARALDYARARAEHFALDHDPEQVVGQTNVFRYRPAEGIILRAQPDASLRDVASSCLAAEIAGARLTLSFDPTFASGGGGSVWGHPLCIEHAHELVARMDAETPRVRVIGTRTAHLDRANQLYGTHLADEPVLPLGRFELLHYVREQSISIDTHRYGHLGLR